MRLRRRSPFQLLPPAAAGLLLLVTVAVVAMALHRAPSSGAGVLGQGISELASATDPEPAPAVEPVAVPLAPPPSAEVVPPPPPPPPAPPSPANLVRTTRAEFLARVQGEALRQVRPDGLPAYGIIGPGGFARMEPGPPMSARAAMPSPVGGPSAAAAGAPAAQPTSATNVQEAGVDEPDLAKTDGRLLVSLGYRSLEVVDVSGAPRVASRLALPADLEPLSVLLVGSRALVFAAAGPPGPQPLPQTDVLVVDLADPSRPRVLWTHRLAGRLVAARLLNGTARVVLAHAPLIPWKLPVDGSRRARTAALAENQRRIRASTFEQWVAPGTGCQEAYTSPVESGLATVAVRTIDPAADQPGPGLCIASQASTVYASPGRLFVGTTTFDVAEAVAQNRAPAEPKTSLHRFDITDPALATYTGSGEVAGTLLNQFSLSERDGDLRVATTRTGVATGSESQVAVLRPNGAALDQVGLLGGLGRHEHIFAVRFVGATGYVVTFSPMMCDPLFVVDLSDPTRPTLRGSLEVQGFSSYLHPIGPGRVLSIGRDAPGARSPGTMCPTTSPQVSLYDVARPDQPRQLHRLVLPRGGSEAERDHHAFTYWPPSRLLIIPASLYEEGFTGALAMRVEDSGIVEAGRISHGDPGSATSSAAIRRSFVVGSRLLTVSSRGVASHDLGTLAGQGFTPFA